jgi:hypothetical protein
MYKQKQQALLYGNVGIYSFQFSSYGWQRYNLKRINWKRTTSIFATANPPPPRLSYQIPYPSLSLSSLCVAGTAY